MRTYKLYIKDELNDRVKKAAEEENLSVENFIVEAIKEKYSQIGSGSKRKRLNQ